MITGYWLIRPVARNYGQLGRRDNQLTGHLIIEITALPVFNSANQVLSSPPRRHSLTSFGLSDPAFPLSVNDVGISSLAPDILYFFDAGSERDRAGLNHNASFVYLVMSPNQCHWRISTFLWRVPVPKDIRSVCLNGSKMIIELLGSG